MKGFVRRTLAAKLSERNMLNYFCLSHNSMILDVVLYIDFTIT
jgi:hypothetical protein